MNKDNDIIRLRLEGALTISRAAELRGILLQSLDRSGTVEIDLDKIEEIDLACLQILCSAHRTAVRDGKSLSIINKNNSVLIRARFKSGFVFQKSCSFNPAHDCLWIGGPEQ
jgi:ABC-type transporter Mla MlaB component